MQAFIFRRSLPELDANHIQPLKRELPRELGNYNETRKRYEFFNGSSIQFQYLERDSDCDRIQGTEIHIALVDEAGQMTPYQLGYIKSRMRLGNFQPKQEGFLPRLVMTANPGGQSHNYLKALYIDPAPAEQYFYDHTMRDPNDPSDKGWVTMYIPARWLTTSISTLHMPLASRHCLMSWPGRCVRRLGSGCWFVFRHLAA